MPGVTTLLSMSASQYRRYLMHAESPIGYTSPPIPGKEHRGMQHESRAFSYLFFKTKLIQHAYRHDHLSSFFRSSRHFNNLFPQVSSLYGTHRKGILTGPLGTSTGTAFPTGDPLHPPHSGLKILISTSRPSPLALDSSQPTGTRQHA